MHALQSKPFVMTNAQSVHDSLQLVHDYAGPIRTT
jgi:hypothetical protein